MDTVALAEAIAFALSLASLAVNLLLTRLAFEFWWRERGGRLNGTAARYATATDNVITHLLAAGLSAITLLYTVLRMRLPSLPDSGWELDLVTWMPLLYAGWGGVKALWKHRYTVRMFALLEKGASHDH